MHVYFVCCNCEYTFDNATELLRLRNTCPCCGSKDIVDSEEFEQMIVDGKLK